MGERGGQGHGRGRGGSGGGRARAPSEDFSRLAESRSRGAAERRRMHGRRAARRRGSSRVPLMRVPSGSSLLETSTPRFMAGAGACCGVASIAHGSLGNPRRRDRSRGRPSESALASAGSADAVPARDSRVDALAAPRRRAPRARSSLNEDPRSRLPRLAWSRRRPRRRVVRRERKPASHAEAWRHHRRLTSAQSLVRRPRPPESQRFSARWCPPRSRDRETVCPYAKFPRGKGYNRAHARSSSALCDLAALAREARGGFVRSRHRPGAG